MKTLTLKNFHQHLWDTYMSSRVPFSVPIKLCPSHFGNIRDWSLPHYKEYYVLANDADTLENAEENLLEQGRLCWMTRRLNEDGSPVLWELGMEELSR